MSTNSSISFLLLFFTMGFAFLFILYLRLHQEKMKLRQLTEQIVNINRRGVFSVTDKTELSQRSLKETGYTKEMASALHALVTTVLERERALDLERSKFSDQTKTLETMGALNRDILRKLSSLILVVGADGRIRQMNPAASQFLGFKLAEAWMVGKEFNEIQQLSQWKELSEKIKPSPETTENSVRLSVKKILNSQGRERVIQAEVVYLRDSQSENSSILGTLIRMEDQTEERTMEARLREAENLASLGRMSAQVAHEVRNPLHSIGLEAELVAELVESLSPLQSPEALQRSRMQLKQSLLSIQSGVDRLEKIINNYLKLSRLSSGEKKHVLLAQVCEEALSAYVPLFEAHRIQVKWDFETPELCINADADLLEQALGNLIKNSIQALEPRRSVESPNWIPEIHIKTFVSEQDEAVLLIDDNGPGIRPEQRANLFQPFVTTKAQGTGLGLAFVKKVIEDHGGSIRLEDSNKRGTRFVLRFPKVIVTQKAQSKGLASSIEQTPQNLSI